MAVLIDADRQDVNKTFQGSVSQRKEAFGALTKADVRAAVNAIDDWLNTNAAALNSAIPQPARGALTTAQKAELTKFVITKRYEKGS